MASSKNTKFTTHDFHFPLNRFSLQSNFTNLSEHGGDSTETNMCNHHLICTKFNAREDGLWIEIGIGLAWNVFLEAEATLREGLSEGLSASAHDT